MSTETHNGHVEHVVQDVRPFTPSTPAPKDGMAKIARDTEAERVIYQTRINELVAERERINALIDVERRETDRCDMIIAWATKEMKLRGKRKAAPSASNKKR